MFASIVASLNQVREDDSPGDTKTIDARAESISLAQKGFIKLEDALLCRGDVPLHPGAKRCYEEPLHPGAKRCYEEQGVDTGE